MTVVLARPKRRSAGIGVNVCLVIKRTKCPMVKRKPPERVTVIGLAILRVNWGSNNWHTARMIATASGMDMAIEMDA